MIVGFALVGTIAASAATGTLIVLLVNSNQHSASMDRRMQLMETALFPPATRARVENGSYSATDPPKNGQAPVTMKGTVDAILPTLVHLQTALARVRRNTGPVRVLPGLTAEISHIGTNTNGITVLPGMARQLDTLPQLTQQLTTLRGQLEALRSNTATISVLPGMASSLGDLQASLDRIGGRVPKLSPLVSDVSSLTERVPNLSPLVTQISHMAKSIDQLTVLIREVNTHVANIDRKFPGAPAPSGTATGVPASAPAP